MPAELSWKELFPYQSRWYTTPDGHRVHYIDVGTGIPVVIVSGFLGWSFQFRNLIRYLVNEHYHVIAVDHLGYGLSDKPRKYDYCLASHIENLTYFLTQVITLPRFHLIAHGVGAPIALGYAATHQHRIRRIVLLGAPSLPQLPSMPGRWLARLPLLNRFLCLHTDIYYRLELRRNTVLTLPKVIQNGYLAPFAKKKDRYAWHRNVRDFKPSTLNYSHVLFNEIALQLRILAPNAILCIGGEEDHIYYPDSYARWQSSLPNALVLKFPHMGHFLLEDLPEKIIPMIGNFLG